MIDGVLVLDKPSGPTSHDVVRGVRRALGTRAVGHAGTLDPLASGVLVIGVGEGTKLLHHLTGADKAYLATLQLGAATDSLDSQGQVTATAAVPEDLTFARVAEVAARFVGDQLQRAPEISAIKQGGERLYERVRRGESVNAPERQVVVRELEVLGVEGAQISLRVACGKGFYVRALARDLAVALGSLGHLIALRRTHSGAFSLADAVDATCLTGPKAAAGEQLRAALMPLSAALRDCARCTLSDAGVIEVGHGRPVFPAHVSSGEWPAAGAEPVALLDEQGSLRALGRAEAERILVIRGIVQRGQLG
jgi:tRNA pseudouridine55 synthase